MNEQLQKALADILTMLQQSAQTVGNTAQTEIPLLVQEYLRWGWYSSLLDALFSAALIAVAAVVAKAVWRKSEDFDNYDKYPARVVSGFLLGAFGIFQFVSVYFALRTAIQIAVAPRVYLLETVMQAIK